jgi:biotin carboxyl carrier protein
VKLRVVVDGRQFDIIVGPGGRIWVDGRPLDADLRGVDDLARYSLLIDNRSYEAHLEREEGRESWLMVAGHSYCARLQGGHVGDSSAGERIGEGTQGEIAAPLPGLLASIPIEVGQRVEQGQVVAVLESMKMNLELRAPVGGVVQAILGEPGCEVVQGQALVTIACEPDGAKPAADR